MTKQSYTNEALGVINIIMSDRTYKKLATESDDCDVRVSADGGEEDHRSDSQRFTFYPSTEAREWARSVLKENFHGGDYIDKFNAIKAYFDALGTGEETDIDRALKLVDGLPGSIGKDAGFLFSRRWNSGYCGHREAFSEFICPCPSKRLVMGYLSGDTRLDEEVETYLGEHLGDCTKCYNEMPQEMRSGEIQPPIPSDELKKRYKSEFERKMQTKEFIKTLEEEIKDSLSPEEQEAAEEAYFQHHLEEARKQFDEAPPEIRYYLLRDFGEVLHHLGKDKYLKYLLPPEERWRLE